jgi:hypothetical protein
MAASLLEPSSLLRAAKRRSVTLAEPTALQICALLEVSRGITLIGSRERVQCVANAILGCAIDAGAARGMLKVKSGVSVADVLAAAERRDWLLFAHLPAEELERVLRPLADLIGDASWRALVMHEPTAGQTLPGLERDLRRHFPLVEIVEGE